MAASVLREPSLTAPELERKAAKALDLRPISRIGVLNAKRGPNFTWLSDLTALKTTRCAA